MRGKLQINVFKRLAAMGAAVMMMASVSAIGASAYSKTFLGETDMSSATTPRYISCYHNGAFTNGYVSGMAWTKTSTVKNVLNPNCKFNGYISVVTACGSVHGNNNNQFANAISCSLSGKYTTTTVTSTHVFQSGTYGNFSMTIKSE